LLSREFRAQRSAEQSNPGNHRSNVINVLKEGVAMVKNVLSKAGIANDTALVALGWLAFVGSFFISELTWLISLQVIARVLP
jgi:hypothetical protein